MIADVSTVLNCSAVKAWNEVQNSSLLLHVMRPLARVVPIDRRFPERWREGSMQCKVYMFGIIPFGLHTIELEKIDEKTHHIQSRERGSLVARWDHLISIKPLDDKRSIYRDTVDIDAGWLTFVVWAWANLLYRHRQRRWRALAKTL